MKNYKKAFQRGLCKNKVALNSTNNKKTFKKIIKTIFFYCLNVCFVDKTTKYQKENSVCRVVLMTSKIGYDIALETIFEVICIWLWSLINTLKVLHPYHWVWLNTMPKTGRSKVLQLFVTSSQIRYSVRYYFSFYHNHWFLFMKGPLSIPLSFFRNVLTSWISYFNPSSHTWSF